MLYQFSKKANKFKKIGLAYLNETLKLGVDTHHRAYSDALTP